MASPTSKASAVSIEFVKLANTPEDCSEEVDLGLFTAIYSIHNLKVLEVEDRLIMIVSAQNLFKNCAHA